MKFYIDTLVRWAAPKAGGLPKRPANFRTTGETIFSFSKPGRQGAQPLIEQTTAAAPPKRWWSRDGRVSKTTEELELTITEAVRTAPGCEAFVGVIVQRITPRSRLGATWELWPNGSRGSQGSLDSHRRTHAAGISSYRWPDQGSNA